MVYANYDYYINEYCGTLPEDSFESLVIKASREIDNNVNTNLTEDLIKNLSEKAQDKLKYTACALVDLINRKQISGNKKLSSVSIDGVSKSYNLLSNSDYKSEKKDIINCLPIELTCYL